jgi:simple sugar transport system permease protein
MWEFAARSLNAATVLTIAALGELIGQRSGILNVGIEGVMLFGATLGFIVARTSENYLLGLLAALVVGGLIGGLHGFFSITLRGDQVVNGMGIWILGFGLTAYIGTRTASWG